MHKSYSLLVTLALCLAASACTESQGPGTPESNAGGPATPAHTAAKSASTVSPWSGTQEGRPETALCALDAVNGIPATSGKFTIPTNEPVVFEGWVSTADLKTPSQLRLVLDGQSDFQISGSTGIARDDVAQAYSAQALAQAGYKIEVSALAVPAGEYAVLLEHDEAGVATICKTNFQVVAN